MDVDVKARDVAFKVKSIDLPADLKDEVHLRVKMVAPVPRGEVVVAGHWPVGEHAVDEVAAGLVVPEDGRVRDFDVVAKRRLVVERGVDALPGELAWVPILGLACDTTTSPQVVNDAQENPPTAVVAVCGHGSSTMLRAPALSRG